ncbi:MAG: hypothetical protein J7494_06460 [Sphingobium sp.]|nr:hypothetical protein [Sphingobium sp.]
MNETDELERLSAAAERIKGSAGLGRSRMLHRLFDYLLERTLQGETPKEVEVAADVFNKSEADLLVDASVRVYVHRLRKKLEEYYSGPGQADTERLTLPKGDYRFRLAEPNEIIEADDEPLVALAVPASARRRSMLLFALIGLVVGALVTFAAVQLIAPADNLKAVRASSIWAPFLASQRPLTVVPGDYYIMGERDKPGTEPSRLVRDYAVNSREDLDGLLMDHPELREKLVDLNLYYLPVSTAYALRSVMPIVTPGLTARGNVPVLPSSKLTPADFKSGDIVYVGLMSGLGILQQAVFSNSRFEVAGSFDELIDTKTGQIYVADPPQDGETARRNYAYVAMLPGPAGNRIMIIAGTRDPALLQAADIVSSPAMLKKLQEAGKDGYFEALFAVDGVGDENLKGTLIAAGPRSIEGLWDGVSGAPDVNPAN